jgi:hypothetical protein
MNRTARQALAAVFSVSLAACGGTAPEPRSPEPKPKPAVAAEKAQPAPELEAAAAPEPEEKDPRADGLRKASRPPNDLITGPNLIYMFNFRQSEVGQAAEQTCGERFGDSRRELAACMEKARSKVPVESIRFIKDPHGQHWWVTYNRYKGNLLKWHKVQYLPGEETDDRITLNLVGKDTGIAPMARVPRHLQVSLPNDYTIVVSDPDHGAMMYDAKIGTIDE